jgi:hypothetical protein
MRRHHRITATGTGSSVLAQLALLGFDGTEELLALRIAEDDPKWSEIHALLSDSGVGSVIDVVTASFANDEIAAAPWVALSTVNHRGYPVELEGRRFFDSPAFDLSGFCEACGIGLRQVGPLRLRLTTSEARLVRGGGVFQPNWLFSSWFGSGATPNVNTWAVLDGRGSVRDGLAQWDLSSVPEVSVALPQHLERETCEVCGRTKHRWPSGDFAPEFAEPMGAANGALILSQQWFGSGASAAQLTYASAAMIEHLRERPLGDLAFQPQMEP